MERKPRAYIRPKLFFSGLVFGRQVYILRSLQKVYPVMEKYYFKLGVRLLMEIKENRKDGALRCEHQRISQTKYFIKSKLKNLQRADQHFVKKIPYSMCKPMSLYSGAY